MFDFTLVRAVVVKNFCQKTKAKNIDLDDLIQEIWLSIWNADYDSRGSREGFVHRIAARRLADLERARPNEILIDDEVLNRLEAANPIENMLSGIHASDSVNSIVSAVGKFLPEDTLVYSKTLHLKYVGDVALTAKHFSVSERIIRTHSAKFLRFCRVAGIAQKTRAEKEYKHDNSDIPIVSVADLLNCLPDNDDTAPWIGSVGSTIAAYGSFTIPHEEIASATGWSVETSAKRLRETIDLCLMAFNILDGGKVNG